MHSWEKLIINYDLNNAMKSSLRWASNHKQVQWPFIIFKRSLWNDEQSSHFSSSSIYSSSFLEIKRRIIDFWCKGRKLGSVENLWVMMLRLKLIYDAKKKWEDLWKIIEFNEFPMGDFQIIIIFFFP